MDWLTGLIGAVSNTFAGYYNSKAEQAQYEANAARDEANATRAAIETTFAEEQMRKKGRQDIANLTASIAENGLIGAAFDKLVEQSIENAYFDAFNVRNQGLSEFYNYKNSAAENRFQARSSARMRRAAVSMGIAKAGALALAGAAKYNQQKLGNDTLGKLSVEDGKYIDKVNAARAQWGDIKKSIAGEVK